jgi:hypothetical protein
MPRFDQPIEPMTLGNMREVDSRPMREGEANQRACLPVGPPPPQFSHCILKCRGATMSLDRTGCAKG